MKKFIIICVTLAVVLTAGSDAFAKSKKYYEYKLKAYPAYKDSKSDKVRRVLGYLGDHTYVCLKGKKKKYGKYSTTKNYGCHARTGGNKGGSTRGKWRIRKSRTAKAGKNGALCTVTHPACNRIYGYHGVCHQDANRMLYGARKAHASIINVHGYTDAFRSYYLYGPYGKWWLWQACKYACYK